MLPLIVLDSALRLQFKILSSPHFFQFKYPGISEDIPKGLTRILLNMLFFNSVSINLQYIVANKLQIIMRSIIKPKACDNLQEIREAIDVIDQEIIQLFAHRHEYVKEIVKFKSGDEEGIIARERKELVLEQRRAWAEERGLDAEMIEKIFRLLIDKNIQIQFDIYNSNNK